jgi:hypothetical protein
MLDRPGGRPRRGIFVTAADLAEVGEQDGDRRTRTTVAVLALQAEDGDHTAGTSGTAGIEAR